MMNTCFSCLQLLDKKWLIFLLIFGNGLITFMAIIYMLKSPKLSVLNIDYGHRYFKNSRTSQRESQLEQKMESRFRHESKMNMSNLPASCSEKYIYSRDMEDFMKINLPRFRPNFKNPCWIEKLPKFKKSPYAENGYLNMKKSKFQFLCAYWQTFVKKSLPRFEKNQKERLRCLPYFFIAGMQKSGTTDLFYRIINHPDFVTEIKEPMFWTGCRFGENP